MNNELISIISYLERDRGVDREIIIQAIESAIQQAARKSLEVTNDLRVEIDRQTLTIKAFDTVVATDEDEGLGLISMRRARRIDPDIKRNACYWFTGGSISDHLYRWFARLYHA